MFSYLLICMQYVQVLAFVIYRTRYCPRALVAYIQMVQFPNFRHTYYIVFLREWESLQIVQYAYSRFLRLCSSQVAPGTMPRLQIHIQVTRPPTFYCTYYTTLKWKSKLACIIWYAYSKLVYSCLSYIAFSVPIRLQINLQITQAAILKHTCYIALEHKRQSYRIVQSTYSECCTST